VVNLASHAEQQVRAGQGEQHVRQCFDRPAESFASSKVKPY